MPSVKTKTQAIRASPIPSCQVSTGTNSAPEHDRIVIPATGTTASRQPVRRDTSPAVGPCAWPQVGHGSSL
ncbi:MAG: hypothetical protein C0524_02210 [Rhodobacter sp.]|nr:hypothetical protein [Rhodobacter sp.]